MTIRLIKPAAIVSTAFLLLILLSKPTHAVSIEVTGNGSDSTSHVNVDQHQQVTVEQTNNATVTNNVNATSNTGNNSADRNTGGSTTIETGDASTSVSISNEVNGSNLSANNTGEVISSHNHNSMVDTSIVISGNGQNSHNFVSFDPRFVTGVTQNNNADVVNNVDADANTGGNSADRNTGGDVLIKTGNASTEVIITNNVNTNSVGIGNKKDEEPEEQPLPTPTEIAAVPATTPAVENPEEVLASTAVLPATGGTGNSNWVIFAALILIALGFYLRRKIEDWYYAYYNI